MDNKQQNEIREVTAIEKGVQYLLLAVIGLYLFLFYVSTIYAVSLRENLAGKDVESLNGLMTGTVEVDVLSILKDHPYGLVFSISGAFIFFVIAYLTHTFLSEGKKIGAGAFLTLNLGGDGLLSYKISEQIHNYKILTRATTNEWQFKTAFETTDFYIILFLGFVAYVLFGLLMNRTFSTKVKIEFEDDDTE